MKNKNIKIVKRAGGLVETNSSSSHAVSICMDEKTNLKQGDPEFDLDIRDGVLYVPERDEEFGWEYEKSNSCETKLQYVCAFYFNNYEPLHVQKSQRKLENILKRILGVKKVVFEWVENYSEQYKISGSKDLYLNCPEINHNSYGDMREQILESEDTIKNFILNPKSWWYGGNDNSDAPPGFYSETLDETLDSQDGPAAIATIDFGGDLGVIDFVSPEFPGCDEYDRSFYDKLKQSEENSFIDEIFWDSVDKKFVLKVSGRYEISDKELWRPGTFVIIDNKMYLYYFSNSMSTDLVVKSDDGYTYRQPEELIQSGNYTEGTDYKILPVKLWTREFGRLFGDV